MKIGEQAERAGAITKQLRYYEEQGLIGPDRTQSNYRSHDKSMVERCARSVA